MSAEVSSRISKKSKWWINENRHMELRYFCRQYSDWRAIAGALKAGSSVVGQRYSYGVSDITGDEAIRREGYLRKMACVELAAKMADEEIADYIFKAVTEGYRYEYLRTVLDIPCGRRQFYERCRKFYWLLDQILESRK